jgi:hypothetical protein
VRPAQLLKQRPLTTPPAERRRQCHSGWEASVLPERTRPLLVAFHSARDSVVSLRSLLRLTKRSADLVGGFSSSRAGREARRANVFRSGVGEEGWLAGGCGAERGAVLESGL